VKDAAGGGIGGEAGDKVLVAWEGTRDANAICELYGVAYVVCDMHRSYETSDRTSRGWGCGKGGKVVKILFSIRTGLGRRTQET
jgi:hypothetical protein